MKRIGLIGGMSWESSIEYCRLINEAIQAGFKIPLLHIADATARQVKSAAIRNIGLLGTRFTMEEELYKGQVTDRRLIIHVGRWHGV